MTDPHELAITLCALRDAFAKLGVEWAIGGSLASSTYAEPRSTNDVDVVARLDEQGARRLGELLGPHFYCSTEAAIDAVRLRDSFNVIDQRSFLKVDVFVPPAGPLGVGQLTRRRELRLVHDLVVPVLGPEDIVLQKLRWYRLGGEVSERQWRDVVAVLRTIEAGGLDDAYLDAIATMTGLDALLARARADSK